MLENSNASIETRVREIERIVKDNNQMLHRMRRAQMWSSVMRVVYWFIILGGGIATYYYLGPILQKLLGFYTSLGDISNLKDLLK